WTTLASAEIVLPDTLDIRGTLAPEVRSYGIYSVPVYTAELKLRGRFLAGDLKALAGTETTYLWDRAELLLPVSDVRGIRRVEALHFAGAEYTLGPSERGVGRTNAIAIPLDLGKLEGEAFPFELGLTLAGTQSLQLLPLARHTEAALSSPWPNP